MFLCQARGNIFDAGVAELTVTKPRHSIILVEALLSFGGRFDVPFDQRHAECAGNLSGENRFASSRLALDQQRPLQRYGRIDRNFKIAGCDITFGAVDAHRLPRGWRKNLAALFGASLGAPQTHGKAAQEHAGENENAASGGWSGGGIGGSLRARLDEPSTRQAPKGVLVVGAEMAGGGRPAFSTCAAVHWLELRWMRFALLTLVKNFRPNE